MSRHPFKSSYNPQNFLCVHVLEGWVSIADQRGYRELLVIISSELSGNAMEQNLPTNLLGLLRYDGLTSIFNMFIKAVW